MARKSSRRGRTMMHRIIKSANSMKGGTYPGLMSKMMMGANLVTRVGRRRAG
jgi:hypothetical protein